jgi:hypothetical protein
MKKSQILAAMILGLASAIAAVPASADSLLYSNIGPTSDATNSAVGFEIDTISGQIISDSFTLTSNSTLTSLNFDALVAEGYSLTSVEWSIGTSPGDSTDGTGTVTGTGLVSQGTITSGLYGAVDERYEFTLPDILLASGTYYLTLQNAVTSNNSFAGWDISNGLSSAYVSYSEGSINWSGGSYDSLIDSEYTGTNSETFNIDGNSTITPEPSSFLLLGSGLAGLAGLNKRKLAT